MGAMLKQACIVCYLMTKECHVIQFGAGGRDTGGQKVSRSCYVYQEFYKRNYLEFGGN